MKLSELIREYVDLKIEGEPAGSDWQSIDTIARQRGAHYMRLMELEEAIDAALAATKGGSAA